MHHTSLSRLAEHIEQRLSRHESLEVEEHLRSGCEQCSRDADWIALLHERTSTDQTSDAPDWLLERAVVLFRRLPMEALTVDSDVATLVYDSRGSPLPTGVRRGMREPMRSLLFRCQGYDVDIQIRPTDAQVFSLRGQVLPIDPTSPLMAGARVEIVDMGELHDSTATDAYGEFVFDEIPTKTFDLRIQPHEGGDLYLPGIEVKAERDLDR